MSSHDVSQISLEVIFNHKVVFSSDGKWLYPLFDLEDFLNTNPIPMKHAYVRDKVVGKAAALLLIHLGTGQIHGDLMSKLAVQTLTLFEVSHSYDRLVHRIDCKTESLLLDINDPEKAHNILCERANRC